jgi:hypothetical protein
MRQRRLPGHGVPPTKKAWRTAAFHAYAYPSPGGPGWTATANMNMLPQSVYSMDQERQLFAHSLTALSPHFYVSYYGDPVELEHDGSLSHATWESWTSVQDVAKQGAAGQVASVCLCDYARGGKTRGQADIAIDGGCIPADRRLLKLKWIKVEEDFRGRTDSGYRPAAILLQLVSQLGRLAKVHGVLVEPARYGSEPFYRSLGFFSFLNEGKEPDFFIDPQHAFNTIGGLLNTRTVRNGDSPAHHVTVNKLPPHMQAIYRLQHQVWDARHGGPRAEALLFDLSICDLPRKQEAAAGHHAPIAVYGRVSVTVNSGTVEVGEPMYYPAAGSHWPVVRAALLSIGRGMGVDLATAAWRMVHQH